MSTPPIFPYTLFVRSLNTFAADKVTADSCYIVALVHTCCKRDGDGDVGSLLDLTGSSITIWYHHTSHLCTGSAWIYQGEENITLCLDKLSLLHTHSPLHSWKGVAARQVAITTVRKTSRHFILVEQNLYATVHKATVRADLVLYKLSVYVP